MKKRWVWMVAAAIVLVILAWLWLSRQPEATVDAAHPVVQTLRAFIEEQAAQCGFCLSGVILTAKALLDENPKATDEQIRESLSTVLCRCFVHGRMLRAIRRYRSELAG